MISHCSKHGAPLAVDQGANFACAFDIDALQLDKGSPTSLAIWALSITAFGGAAQTDAWCCIIDM